MAQLNVTIVEAKDFGRPIRREPELHVSKGSKWIEVVILLDESTNGIPHPANRLS
jgi:hypothetical protein